MFIARIVAVPIGLFGIRTYVVHGIVWYRAWRGERTGSGLPLLGGLCALLGLAPFA